MIQSDSYFLEGLKPPTSICIYTYVHKHTYIRAPEANPSEHVYFFPFLGASNDGIHNIWDNPSHWLIFFRGVETTNQIICIYIIFLNFSEGLRVKHHFWVVMFTEEWPPKLFFHSWGFDQLTRAKLGGKLFLSRWICILEQAICKKKQVGKG